MITDAFDPVSREIVRAEDAVRETDKEIAAGFALDTFILTFSERLIGALREENVIEPLDERLRVGSSAYKSPVFRIRGTSVGVALTGIGAPMVAAMLEELAVLFPARRFILFGSCGALTALPEGKLIVPTHACRDEGTSYHYAPPDDYITVRNAPVLTRIFDELGVGYVTGRTWTTDAFYRETERNRDERVAEGCVCVEMECAAAQAVCDYRGWELYQFVYAADSLDGDWARRILGRMETDARMKYFALAREVAVRLQDRPCAF